MFPSDTDFDTKVTLETESSPVVLDEAPFHILILGDWSGRESRAIDPDSVLAKPIEIDRDNFEEVLQKLDVRLELDFQNNKENIMSLEFTEFEDFHPDKIFQRLSIFADLRDVRRRLINSETFNSAAREVRSWLIETENEKVSETEPQNSIAEEVETPVDLLKQILSNSTDDNTTINSQTAEKSALADLVKKLVKPYLIQTDLVEQSKLLMIVDEVISDLMRKILHHPQFQALESAWRGAYFLIRRLETDNQLKIYIMDVSKNSLAFNLKSVNDLTESSLYRVLTHHEGDYFNNSSWAMVCGNYTFSLNVDDVATLIRVAKISADKNVAFISHTKPAIFGYESFAEIDFSETLKVSEGSIEEKLWMMLRSTSGAEYIGLALPRTLARLPYGKDTEPIENFHFEEFISLVSHEDYLWTNPIFVNALLIAQTFQQHGWKITENLYQQIEGFPIHSYKDAFENKTQPCAEILMTENNCQKILGMGLIPLISFKDENKIRVGRLQSIASSPTILKGKWG